MRGSRFLKKTSFFPVWDLVTTGKQVEKNFATKKILQNFEGHDHWHCQYITFGDIYIFQSGWGNVVEIWEFDTTSRAYSRPILCSAIACCHLCENYTKLYFDAKHLWRGLNKEGGKIVGALFSKKCSFWPGAFPDKVTLDIHFIDEAVVQYYAPVVKIIL